MKQYPVHVPREAYRGSNPAKLRKVERHNRVALRIEEFINTEMAAAPENAVRVFISGFIAIDLGEDADLVQRIVFGIDCGHNGVTVLKGDFDRAMEAKDRQSAEAT